MNTATHIVIGLGNPGGKFAKHRHNVGFMVLDAYADKTGLHFAQKDLFYAHVAQDTTGTIYAKPETFMNDSGRAARMIAKQYSLPVVVVYDDIDIPIGTVKCSFDRGAGGHNGVQSLIDHLGTTAFARIRVGVRPVHEELLPRIAPPDGFEKFLLSDFAPMEDELKKQGIDRAVEIIEALKTKTFENLMNQYN
jgi:PTH1 family peptidyl-tRNA hydrolase